LTDDISQKIVKLVPPAPKVKDPANDPDQVLLAAMGKYTDVLILGYKDEHSDLDIRSTDYFADGGNVLWALETFKFNLLSGVYGPNEDDE
jgi:hypothetical protein